MDRVTRLMVVSILFAAIGLFENEKDYGSVVMGKR
jgi:hypothetical protein